MHGLAKRPIPSAAVRGVRIGDELAVRHDGHHWVVYNSDGVPLGHTRWGATREPSKFPPSEPEAFPRGTLHVDRLVVSPDGTVVDVLGYVTPNL
jgi:hypothetical protein